MNRSTLAIAALSVGSGLSAALVGAVSLTRIANDQLGFPDGLPWTFTASSDIGAVAGAIMWTASAPDSSTRRTGVGLNVVCTTVSALGVGLDHFNHASTALPLWPWAAFAIGVFLPLLSTWLVHGLAKMAWTYPVAPAVDESTADTVTASIEQESTETAETQEALPPRPTAVARVPITDAFSERREESDTHIAWARTNWPVTAQQIMSKRGAAKGSAHRIVNQLRAERRSVS